MNAKIYNGNVQPNPKEFKIWVNDEGLIKTWNGTEWVENTAGEGDSGSGGSFMQEVTYAELKALRNESKLVAGLKYRMIDYETTTSQEGTLSAGHPFDLILTALDEKTLDEKCSAIQSARDTDGYFANSNLAAWEVWYTLDNTKYGFGVVKGLSFTVMGINVKCAENGKYTYNDIEYDSFIGTAIFEGMTVLVKNTNPTTGDDLIILNGGVEDNSLNTRIDNINYSQNEGKGIIYKLIDEFNNNVPWDFKNIEIISKKKGYLCYTFTDTEGTNIDGSVTGEASNNYIECSEDIIALAGIPIITIKYPKYLNLIFTSYDLPSDISIPYSLEICSPVHNSSFINCYDVIIDTGEYRAVKGNFKNLTKVNINKLCVVKEMHNISNIDINEYYSNYCTVTQAADGSIISYTDEDIYNAIQANLSTNE